jgi:hypothetical protein
MLKLFNEPLELSPATINLLIFIIIGMLAIVIVGTVVSEAIRQWWES